MTHLLIVDLQTLWLIGGATILAAAATLLFLRSLHHPSASVLGLHALALSLGGNGLLVAGVASGPYNMLPDAIAEIGIASGTMVACEAVRRLYGAVPRPAVLFAFLFALVAGTLGFDAIRNAAPVRMAFTSSLMALPAALTTIRVARARDPSADAIRRLIIVCGAAFSVVCIARAAVAFQDPDFAVTSEAVRASAFELVIMASITLIPMAVTGLMLAAVHARMADELRAMATTDPLTRLMSRRVLFESGEPLLAATRLAGRLTAAMMVDIDHFKQINDVHGHAAGDYVLRHCARQLRSGARAEALVARYGGEEFCLLVPIERERDAFVAAERLRHRVASQPCAVDGTTIELTVSIGVAIHEHGQRLAQLLARADELLYEAKRAGRNRVVSVDSPASQPDLALLVV